MYKASHFRIEKFVIIWIFFFYSSSNSFWGHRLFINSNAFAAFAALFPAVLILYILLRQKIRMKKDLLFFSVCLFAVIAISSGFGAKYLLYYGLCILLLFLSDIAEYRSLLKLFYFLAILFTIGSLINLLLPSVYKAIVLPAFSGSTQYARLAKWANRSQNKIIPGFANQTSFNACHLVYGIGYLGNKLIIKKRLRFKEWIILALFVFCLILTNKRAHFLFTMLALVFCYYFTAENKNKGKRLLAIALGGTLALLLLYYLINHIDAGVFRKLRETLIKYENEEDISSGRVYLYSLALKYFNQHPIFGIGWEQFRLLPEHSNPISTHNIYLELLCETGIIGVTVFLCFFVKAFRTAILNWKNRTDGETGFYAAFCVFMQLFFLLYGLTGNPLYDPPYYFPYFLICAYTFSFDRFLSNPANCIQER